MREGRTYMGTGTEPVALGKRRPSRQRKPSLLDARIGTRRPETVSKLGSKFGRIFLTQSSGSHSVSEERLKENSDFSIVRREVTTYLVRAITQTRSETSLATKARKTL